MSSPMSSTFSLVPAVPPAEEALEAPPPVSPAPPELPVQSESALIGSPLQSQFSLVSFTEVQAASQEPLGTEMVWPTHPHAHLPPASPMLASAVPPGQMPPGCGVAVPIDDSDTESAASNATMLIGEVVPGAGYPPPEPPEPLGVMQLGQASAEGGGAGPPVDAQPPAIASAPALAPVLPVRTDDSWADLIDTVVSLPSFGSLLPTPPVVKEAPPPAPKGPPAAPAPGAGGAAPWGRGPPGTGTNLGNVGANLPSWTPGRRADVAAGYKLMVGSVPPGDINNVAASVVCGGGEFWGWAKV